MPKSYFSKLLPNLPHLMVALVFCISTTALSAQTAPPKQDPKPKTENKKVDPGKQDVKPAKPAEPKKDQEKKADPKKADPKKDEGKKSAGKKQEPTKSRTRTRTRSSTYRKYNKENPQTLALFGPVVAEASQSTVAVLAGTRRIAYGSIVDSSGLILTKSSELRGPLKCRLPGNRVVEAKIFGIDPETDLALLKIEEHMLPFIRFDNTVKTPDVGSWLACAGTTEKPISIGVVSVAERRIPAASGFMGVRLGERPREGGVPIDDVTPGLPADNGGVKKGDVIIEVNGKKTPNRVKLIEIVSGMPPGEKIHVIVLRAKKKENIQIILGNREELNAEEFKRSNQQNTMSGSINKRRKDFPLAFRHDGFLSHSECGGPVVNLDGQVIGINIARGGRVESLTIPNAVVNTVIAKLKTGSFTPAVVNKEKIDLIQTQLKSIQPVRNFESKKNRLQADFDRDEAVEEKLQAILDDIKKQMEEARKAKEEAKAKLKELKDADKKSRTQKAELEKELERLKKGMG